EGPEIPADRGSPEFVVEGGAAERALDHDVQGRDDPAGLAVFLFPRLHRAGELQVRNGETGQPSLGLGAAAGRALVANLAARTGGGAGKRRDGGGVIVGLHLAEQMNL